MVGATCRLYPIDVEMTLGDKKVRVPVRSIAGGVNSGRSLVHSTLAPVPCLFSRLGQSKQLSQLV